MVLCFRITLPLPAWGGRDARDPDKSSPPRVDFKLEIHQMHVQTVYAPDIIARGALAKSEPEAVATGQKFNCFCMVSELQALSIKTF
jgi:hypothetical protein